MLGSASDGEPILNPQVMCLYICNNNTEGRGGGGGNKMLPPCLIVNIEYCGQPL